MPQKNTVGGDGTGITPTQMKVIESLLAGSTVTAAAGTDGVSRETVHRWKKDDWQFQAVLSSSRREIQVAIRIGC